MPRLEVNPRRVDVLDVDALGFGTLQLSLHLAEVALSAFADLAAEVARAHHLTGRLHAIERPALGALAQHLLVGHHLELLERELWVPLAQILQRLNVVAARLLELPRLGRVRVQVLVEHAVRDLVLRLYLQLDTPVRVAGLCLHDNTPLVHPVPLVQVLVDQQSSVSHIGGEHCGREEAEGEQTLPDLQYTRTAHREDDVQPDVGEDAPGRGYEEHPQMLDLAGLAVRYDGDAEGDYDEEIVGRGADDRAGPELARLEVLRVDLDDGQEDLGGAASKCHQGKIGDSLVPDAHDDDLGLLARPLHQQLLLLRGDHLDRGHEAVRDYGDADEEVEQYEEVDDAPEHDVEELEVLDRVPDRDDQALLAARRVVARHCQAATSLLCVYDSNCSAALITAAAAAAAAAAADRHQVCSPTAVLLLPSLEEP